MTAAKKTAAAKATVSAKPPATAKVNEPVEAAVMASKETVETVETVVKAGTEAATKGVEKAVTMGREQVAAAVKAGSDAFRNYEDVVAFNKKNLDAVMKANAVFVKGMQDLSKEFFSMTQASLDSNADAAQKLLNCKSVEEMVSLQNTLFTDSYAKALDQSRKITDLSVKIAENASAPLAGRVNATVDRFTKPLAA